MACFDGSSAKRHKIWSNDASFIGDIISRGGYLSHTAKSHLASAALVTQRVDPRTGIRTFTGVKKKLKASQILVSI